MYNKGTTKKLFTVSGRAQGVEVKMDTDYISFGKVVLNSRSIKKLQLDNTGDKVSYIKIISFVYQSIHVTVSFY